MEELQRLRGVSQSGKGVKQAEFWRLELAKPPVETKGGCPCLGGVSIPSGVSQCSPFLLAVGSDRRGELDQEDQEEDHCAASLCRAGGQGPQSQQEKVAVFSSQYSACPCSVLSPADISLDCSHPSLGTQVVASGPATARSLLFPSFGVPHAGQFHTAPC